MPVENGWQPDYFLPAMLEDREYMRAPGIETRRPVTITLLIFNVVAFVLQNMAGHWFPNLPVNPLFALSVEGLRHGYVWQLLTYQFMHGGLVHLLLNCWVIYMFGREVESALGRKHFLSLYFTSGVFGGLLQVLGAVLWSSHFGGSVVGASAGAFGLIAAFSMLYPDRVITLLLFFVLPVSLRARSLLIVSALIALFGIVFPTDNVAHAAHLGGMVFGIFYVRQIVHWQWPDLRRPLRRLPPRELVGVHSAKWSVSRPPQRAPTDELSPEDFLSKEVDPILDKISAHGIQSLTERERKILEAARKKMAQR
jgi:membrane associated rhomboid family serine protease